MSLRITLCIFLIYVMAMLFEQRAYPQDITKNVRHDRSRLIVRFEKSIKANNIQLAIPRFVGFLEATLDIEAPQEWCDLLSAAIAGTNTRKLDFSLGHIKDERKRRSIFLKASNRKKSDLPNAPLPKELAEKVNSQLYRWNTLERGEITFLLLLGPSEVDGQLFRLDSSTGAVKWSKSTSANESSNRFKTSTGFNIGATFIDANDDYVSLFSWTTEAACIKIFGCDEGMELFSFEYRNREHLGTPTKQTK